jgi:tetratricopeptide (TPR) repeat protein
MAGLARSNLCQYEVAVEAYEQTVRTDPKVFEAHVSLGVTYIEMGRDQEALDVLKRADKLKPSHPQILHDLTVVYLKVGDRGLGLEHYRNLQRLDPTLATGLSKLITSSSKLMAGQFRFQENCSAIGIHRRPQIVHIQP